MLCFCGRGRASCRKLSYSTGVAFAYAGPQNVPVNSSVENGSQTEEPLVQPSICTRVRHRIGRLFAVLSYVFAVLPVLLFVLGEFLPSLNNDVRSAGAIAVFVSGLLSGPLGLTAFPLLKGDKSEMGLMAALVGFVCLMTYGTLFGGILLAVLSMGNWG